MRHLLDAWLRGDGVDEPPRAAVVLATHEAVANAIQHAGAPGHVVVRAEFGSDGVVIEVSDDGHWKPPDDRPSEDRGRGLTLIRSLVSGAQMKTGSCGTTVRIHQNASGPRGRRSLLLAAPRKGDVTAIEAVSRLDHAASFDARSGTEMGQKGRAMPRTRAGRLIHGGPRRPARAPGRGRGVGVRRVRRSGRSGPKVRRSRPARVRHLRDPGCGRLGLRGGLLVGLLCGCLAALWWGSTSSTRARPGSSRARQPVSQWASCSGGSSTRPDVS